MGDGVTALGFSVDDVNAMVRERFPGSNSLCHQLGADFAVASYAAAPTDIRPGGFISGPTQFGLVDAALWFLTFVAIGRIEPMALTSELSIRYLRPCQGDVIYCRATLESVSRRSVVGTCHVWADDRVGKPTATAQGTYALPLP
jgi:acyl-coenzyme A thioesterase PaaI-like protein